MTTKEILRALILGYSIVDRTNPEEHITYWFDCGTGKICVHRQIRDELPTVLGTGDLPDFENLELAISAPPK